MREGLMMRKLLSSLLASMIAGVLVLLAVPSQKAEACLPCNCPTNTSVNCYGDFALYVRENSRTGVCTIEVLGVNPTTGRPRPAIRVSSTSREWRDAGDTPEQNTLIKEYYEFALYRLTTGEFQLNVGPDAENKVFVVIWTGCPPQEVEESTFISEQ
jgi:hypothetical protein